MLNEIAYTFKLASFELFTSVRIFFLHTKTNKLRFWSFEMPFPGLYVLNLMNSAVTPDNCADCELPLESLRSEIWNLKTMLQQTVASVAALKRSHIENQRSINRAQRQRRDLNPILLTDNLRIEC